jgi:hypothetical protein
MSIFEQLIDAIESSIDIFGGAVVRPAEPGDECYQKLDKEFETCAIVSGIDPEIYKKKVLKENNYWNDTRKFVFSTKQAERAATDFITRIGLIEQVVVTIEKRWASD